MPTPKKAKPAPTSTPSKPKAAPARKKTLLQSAPKHEDIAVRAYFLAQTHPANSEFDNWIQAESQLKAGL